MATPKEEKTVQLRVKPRRIVLGFPPGTIFYETPARARQLLDWGAVELLSGKVPGPTETKPAGPTEVKTQFSNAAPGGLSNDSAPSAPGHGADALPSASEEGQASQSSSANSFETQQPAPEESEPSPSTTRTNARRGRR